MAQTMPHALYYFQVVDLKENLYNIPENFSAASIILEIQRMYNGKKQFERQGKKQSKLHIFKVYLNAKLTTMAQNWLKCTWR